MITLGNFDPEVQPRALDEYVAHTKQLTGVQDWKGNKLRGDKDGEWVDFQKLAGSDMKVAELQNFLKAAGFFPFGKVDGICGYRTTSAIRLFQEYVRTVEGQEGIGFPDGKLGPNSEAHVKRWKAANKKADWASFSSAKPSPEYTKWMGLLGKVKQKYAAAPNKTLQLVNQFSQPSDTVKVANWDFNPSKIHLVGVRRNETKVAARAGERKFDDGFVLLINGLAFKFYGSTDPGETSNPKGMPFLVQGQHLYRFGWHKLSDQNRVYNALKPLSSGVLVVRSKDMVLTDADLAGGLERNNSINIHWGGEGISTVGAWSEGCQVFVGKGYINHNGKVVDCSQYAAPNYSTLGTSVNGIYQTKGAYTVLGDLVAAFSGEDNVMRYMLIYDEDLALTSDAGIAKELEILRQFE
ncbi:peptidoglycan-binding protein [candidate division KSB1 bacterium]|nr:peptidoglycan-binding protein [candidate division KSB1 bacterium]